MGLTVYYDFHLPLAVSAYEVQTLLERWRNFAAELGAGRVTPLLAIEPDDIFAQGTVSERDRLSGAERCYAVPVLEGWQFVLQPAARCETLRIALCRYPTHIQCGSRRRRTRLDGGWRYRSFCKTQYASLGGWEIFLAPIAPWSPASRTGANTACVCESAMMAATGRGAMNGRFVHGSTR